MRGCDPHAAIYWLAKLLYPGEDLRFIVRRIVICASEISALRIRRRCSSLWPRNSPPNSSVCPKPDSAGARAVYVATAPKINPAYLAIGETRRRRPHGSDVARAAAPTRFPLQRRETLGHGGDYQYSHDHEDAYVPQAYLPEGRRYYEPSDWGHEKRVAERLAHWRALYEQSRDDK